MTTSLIWAVQFYLDLCALPPFARIRMTTFQQVELARQQLSEAEATRAAR
jgi:hypothetical protein